MRSEAAMLDFFTRTGSTALAEMYSRRAGDKLDQVACLIRDYKDAPPEMKRVIEAARAIFDAAPIPVWCKWAGEERLLYSNPHYKATILDYEGGFDRHAWGEEVGGQFADNDSAAGREPGGLLVHERGLNPTTNRDEHWWIAKWRQVVETPEGPRTLVWGALLSTVAHHRQGPTADGSQPDRRSGAGCGEGLAGRRA